MMNNEAVLSSRIEGTQATLDEVLEHEAGAETTEAKRNDIEEILNYRACVLFASDVLRERGLTLSLLRELHQRLMAGVRGHDKRPGEFRTEQNWIGRPGSSIEQARFVPPDPVRMRDCLDNWEHYVSRTADEDPLIVAAIAHAQFEIIHPFNDGNGRIGRIIIPLVLAERHALSSPMLYMSEYFEQNREQYYDRLLAITQHDDWMGWLTFFLNAVRVQSENNLDRAHRLHGLYTEMRQKFIEATRSQHAASALDAFFARPIISATDFFRTGGFNTKATANNILVQLEKTGLITCIRRGKGRRPSRYAMLSILRIAQGEAQVL